MLKSSTSLRESSTSNSENIQKKFRKNLKVSFEKVYFQIGNAVCFRKRFLSAKMQMCVRKNVFASNLTSNFLTLTLGCLLQYLSRPTTQANVKAKQFLVLFSHPSCGLLDVELEVALKPGSVMVVVQQLLKKKKQF